MVNKEVLESTHWFHKNISKIVWCRMKIRLESGVQDVEDAFMPN